MDFTQIEVVLFSPEQQRVEHLSCFFEAELIPFRTFLDRQECLRHVQQFPADLLVVDQAQRVGEGWSLCESLDQGREPSPAVLVITDIDDYEFLRDLLQLHVDDFLLEPFASAELLVRIERVLQCKQDRSGVRDARLDKLTRQMDDFDLIRKIDMIRQELANSGDGLVGIFEDLRGDLGKAVETLARAEFSLQFTDRVAQQVNEIGKLVYAIHVGVKHGKPYTEEQGRSLERSSSRSVMEQGDELTTEELLKSLDI